jgi:hypothetical protein
LKDVTNFAYDITYKNMAHFCVEPTTQWMSCDVDGNGQEFIHSFVSSKLDDILASIAVEVAANRTCSWRPRKNAPYIPIAKFLQIAAQPHNKHTNLLLEAPVVHFVFPQHVCRLTSLCMR